MRRIPALDLQRVQDDRLEDCLEGTGQWLLQHPTFRQWMDSPNPQRLWVYGKHGCGKSHLAALAIDHISKAEAEVHALSYVYCNSVDASHAVRSSGTSNDTSAIDVDQLVGTMLKQLLQSIPVNEYPQCLERPRGTAGDNPPTREQMRTAIVEVLSQLPKAFVVVDGLDECHKLGDRAFGRLCDFIGSLPGKILVFSRPNYAEIDKGLSRALSLRVDGGANAEDIGLFVNKKMSGINVSAGKLDEISSKLVSRADGMFLWVDLVWGTLKNEGSVRGIGKAIESLPEGLDTVYEWSMERIFRQGHAVRERAFNLLLWTANAQRQLSRAEMMEILAIEPGMTDLDEDTRLIDDHGFVTECADLIVLSREGYYELLHISLQEYLQSTTKTTNQSTSPAIKHYTEMQRRAGALMAGTCLTYLNFGTFQKGPADTPTAYYEFLKANPFFRYASLHWGFHMDSKWKVFDPDVDEQTQPKEPVPLAELAIRLVLSEPARNACLQHILKSTRWVVPPYGKMPRLFPFERGSTALHILAFFGLTRLVVENPSLWRFVYQADGYGNYPFKYAIAMSENDMCHLLLDLDEVGDRNDGWLARRNVFWLRNRDALHFASHFNWPFVMERMLKRGLDPDAPAGTWDPPLHIAAQKGSSQALEVLMKGGADLNLMTQERETALTIATAREDEDMVALLIEKGAKVNVKSGPRNQTPLHIAARTGNTGIARLLLQHGCDANATDDICFTPLIQAVYSGRLEMAEMLVREYQADLTATCGGGTDSLHLAVGSGNCELVNLLLDLGLQPTTTPKYQYSILHSAVNSIGMLKMLLQRFPAMDLRAINTYGETPLHFAATNGHVESVRHLLALYPALATVCTPLAGLPLHSAISGNKPECAEALVTRDNVNAKGPKGQTPLILAASLGHLALVDLMIQQGANVDATDTEGQTALLAAAASGHLSVVDRLVERGADLTVADKNGWGLLLHLLCKDHFSAAGCLLQRRGVQVNEVTSTGLTPLLAASMLNWNPLTARLLELGASHTPQWKRNGRDAFLRAVSNHRTASIDLFERRGAADYRVVDHDGAGTAHWAARGDNLPLLKRVWAADEALVRRPDYMGSDVLSDAVAYNSQSTVRFLLGAGFDPDGLQPNFAGCTPLMRAAWNARATCVKLLIKAGANVTRVGGAPWHRNAGHWAATNGCPRTTAALLKAGVDFASRDALGYSVADYARMSAAVWRKTKRYVRESPSREALGPEHQDPGRRGDAQRVLQKTIVDCANALLQLNCALLDNATWERQNASRPPQAAQTEVRRRHHLACLALALDRLHHLWSDDSPHGAHRPYYRGSALEDACLCTQEVCRSQYTSTHGVWWQNCALCKSTFSGEAIFKCKSCPEKFICNT